MKQLFSLGFCCLLCLLPSILSAQTLAIQTGRSISICPDSTVWNWGFARLGDTIGITKKLLPVQVKGPGGLGVLDSVVAVSLVGGTAHVILADSTVWGWGEASDGRLGTGDEIDQDFPVQIDGPNGVGLMDSAIAITGEYQSTLILRADSTVWGWGWNGTGVLGDGTNFNDRLSPVQVVEGGGSGAPLDSIIAIASGPEFGLGLDADGTVWAWGRSYYGEIGHGPGGGGTYLGAYRVKSPTAFGFLSDIIAVAAGDNTAAALRSDGTVWTWGYGRTGEMGNGTTTSSNLPVQVKDTTGLFFLQDIVSIDVGRNHVVALDQNGQVFVWGSNEFGQLGDPSEGRFSTIPVKMKVISPATEIFAGGNSTAILNDNGEIFMWGDNLRGNLGNGDQLQQVIAPLPVLNPQGTAPVSGIQRISAGYESQMALTNQGQVLQWGETAEVEFSQQTLNFISYASSVPVLINDSTGNNPLNGIQKIAAGETHRLALTQSGLVYGWGSTGDYKLSAKNKSWVTDPEPVKYFGGSLLVNVRDIAASSRHSMYLMNDSTIQYTGYMPGVSRAYPFTVRANSSGDTLRSITAIAAGNGVSLALDKDSTIWAWGANSSGQLGNGTGNNSNYPVKVLAPNGTDTLSAIVKIDIFDDVALAVDTAGHVYAWGDNGAGQLGTGDQTNSLLPRMVMDSSGQAPLAAITDVAAGEFHCLALTADSTVWVWGYNAYGNFGDSTFVTSSWLPKPVVDQDGTPVSGVVDLEAGVFLSTLRKADGSLLSFGFNLEGQTGTQPSLGQAAPVQAKVPCRMFAPIAGFSATQTQGCPGLCVSFTDTSTLSPTGRIWEFPGSNTPTSTMANPSVCYDSAGIYPVTLISVNDVGKDTLIQQTFIEVFANPEASAGADVVACEGDQVPLNASGGQSYEWNVSPDLSCSQCQSPILTLNGPGEYTVLVTDANGCQDTDSVVAVALPLPLADAGPDTVACAGDIVQLTASGGASYLWETSPNLSCTTCPDPLLTIAGDEVLTVEVVGQNGCTATDSVQILQKEPSTADFTLSYDPSINSLSTTNASTSADLIVWDYGDGTMDTAAVGAHTYSLLQGSVEVCMYTYSDCGNDTLCQTLALTSLDDGAAVLVNAVEIHPNPSSGEVSIRLSSAGMKGIVQISDLAGRVVDSIPLTGNQTSIQHQLRLPAGVYQYWLESNGNRSGARSLVIVR